MKNIFMRFLAFILMLVLLSFCFSCSSVDTEEKKYVVLEQSISYTGLSRGNVIDEGKVGFYINFSSEYEVVEIEGKGSLVDIDGNIIQSFDTSLSFNKGTKKPMLIVMVEESVFKRIVAASITEVKAYTTEKIK